jgi:F0F1-type ATP synthase assembly protein I
MSGRSRGDWSQAGSLGFTFIAFVLLFTWLGYLFDGWLHTRPWLMIVGVFIGGSMGFAYLVRTLFSDLDKKDERDDDPAEDSPKEDGPKEDEGPERRSR